MRRSEVGDGRRERAGSGPRSGVRVVTGTVVGLVATAFLTLDGASWLSASGAQWRDDHPHATVAGSTDASSLLRSGLVPASWPVTGVCARSAEGRCVHYEGVAVVDQACSSKDAASALAGTVAAAGLDVREVTCGPLAGGGDQCFVRAVA